MEVSVLANRETKPVRATAVVTPGEEEVILSDTTLDQLGIILLKPGEGLWRLTTDQPGVKRKSEPPQTW